MIKFTIDPRIFELFPDLLLGVIALRGIDNRGHPPAIDPLLRQAEREALRAVAGAPIIEHPKIVPWREAYRKFGAKPKDYPSSIENLVRRVAKGEPVRHINKLVDLYNVVSLRHLLPLGGEDTDKLVGDVRLTMAGSDEPAVVMLGEKEARAPYPNEVIYTDDAGAICRRWNWKEADRTKLTEETRNAFLVIEALPPVRRDEVEAALGEVAGLVRKYCGGEIQLRVLDHQSLDVSIGN